MGQRDGKPTLSTPAQSAKESELSERLRGLERKLDAHRASREEDIRESGEAPSGRNYALALRLGADFVAGVVVGGAIGWGIDRLFGTSPWGLIVFLLMGFVAGVLTVLRTAGLVKPGPSGPDDRKV